MCRENKYIPPGQRNREAMSWGPGRQNSPRLAQSSAGPPTPRAGPHDYSPSSGADQRVVNGGTVNYITPKPLRSYLLQNLYTGALDGNWVVYNDPLLFFSYTG